MKSQILYHYHYYFYYYASIIHFEIWNCNSSSIGLFVLAIRGLLNFRIVFPVSVLSEMGILFEVAPFS